MDTQSIYHKTIKFAAGKHSEIDQLVPGTKLPYVVHLSNVAMEVFMAYQNSLNEKFDLNYALQLALLHDTLEDTNTSFEEIENLFGIDVARGVSALTKNQKLPESEQMQDSLNRIKNSFKEVSIVKMADRITNLQPPPPHWSKQKIEQYKNEAITILTNLKAANKYLEQRLDQLINNYGRD